MKKFLAMILVAMMAVVACAAFAEWDPAADAVPEVNNAIEAVAEQPAVEAPAPEAPAAASVGTPEGYKIYMNEPYTASDYGTIFVRSAEFVDVATAMEPAEDSAKLAASSGNKMFQVRMVYHPLADGQPFASAFTCNVITEGEYQGRLMVEGSTNEINSRFIGHADPECTSYNHNYYLLNTVGSDAPMSKLHASSTAFYLFDYIVEVPASLADSSAPVYVQLNVNGEMVYVQVR